MLTLHGSRTSPYVRLVRLLLEEAGAPYSFVNVDAWDVDSPVWALSPLGKVPVLELGGGDVLFESSIICAHLLDAYPGLEAGEGDRLADRRRQALARGLIDACVARVMERRRPEPQQSAVLMEREERRIVEALRRAEAEAAAPSSAIFAGDIMLAAALQYLEFRYERSWREAHPSLGAWLAPIATRPSFRAVLPPAEVVVPN